MCVYMLFYQCFYTFNIALIKNFMYIIIVVNFMQIAYKFKYIKNCSIHLNLNLLFPKYYFLKYLFIMFPNYYFALRNIIL